jgi:hypothetical protein
LAFSDYAQKDFDAPPVRSRGFLPDDERRSPSLRLRHG